MICPKKEMQNQINGMSQMHNLLSLNRNYKILISCFVDTIISLVSLYAAIVLRMEDLWHSEIFQNSMNFILLSPIIIAISGRFAGIHKSIIGSFDIDELGKIAIYSLTTTLFLILVNYLTFSFIPRSIPIIYTIIFILLVIFSRFTFRSLLQLSARYSSNETNSIFIYGAGSAGIRLLKYLRTEPKNNIFGFIDDNASLDTLTISGFEIFTKNRFKEKYKNKIFNEIWIAMPSSQKENIKNAYDFSKNHSDKVLTLPEINQMMLSGKIENIFKDKQNLNFIDRDEISINKSLFSSSYEDKVIMVTGAGGSIGSELVRQLLNINAKKIILLDNSEHALYQINYEIENQLKSETDYVSYLGSINDQILINKIIIENNIEVVIHAAAYKHVPLVEFNALEGIKNNVIGTYNLLQSCLNNNVNKFILISSDKAVRPTSVMGKTKRIAEIIVQNMAMKNTNFKSGIVRFGNVLGSSGSVIPLFQKQILNGGPVTITDKKMTRYFMALPEASQLVLTAGHYAHKSEIFLLDMGKPISIFNLAKSMINFYGYKYTEKKESNNDIEIKITNIRPGEKLYEELLIDNNAIETNHPKVLIDRTDIRMIEDTEIFISEINKMIEENQKELVINKIDKLLGEDK
jgi:FlaA1/EpsC-like NDP-sugar epimerase